MQAPLKTRTIGMIWLAHCLFTTGGYYFVSAMAQGVADGGAEAPLTLIVVNALVEILSFPILTVATIVFPMSIGGWNLSTFVPFLALAAVNSAVWAAAIGALFAAIRKSSPSK